MAALGNTTEHGYAERLMRTFKEEEVTLHDCIDFHEAYQHLGQFVD
jgi:putative transposase